ncbi:Retrieval of early ER protein Rer1 like protein [Aduncisulcus paluster]|uniref:Retrieval of early ER protein Rer1 like protein n=1 Tax=Aduncisulcus paluster TaxID=2918883 RepID=A0ABQ5JYR0_9EUKA|nr:Retrieval of early ER protein Rer1 like protein [Aduncisulcus paluster]|eukprot:gnl/Carplike_NY0171/1883_a2553_868.p1 GENE.gnl/Carplike_NY0171/1883_a2553_868~~gnl/Carplike_NY0171/1883_a2553_868.p1  ORF type:complete len:225 (+),score=36.07 gnl/Carplike_NY0171/1883_a2553_868:41-715(+)
MDADEKTTEYNGSDFIPGQTTLPTIVKHYKTKMDHVTDKYLNLTIPFKTGRWIIAAVIALLFILRCVFTSSPFHYVLVMYCLYVYIIVHFLLFITPLGAPQSHSPNEIIPMDSDFMFDDEDGLRLEMLQLPNKADERDDEYKPFIPQLPEFKFWWLFVKSHLICLFLTLFQVFDIPVYWPILFMYLAFVVVLTALDEMKKWKEYGYVPFDFLRKKQNRKTKFDS